MFKLFFLAAILAIGAAAPAPAPAPGLVAPIVSPYSAPLIPSYGTPLAYSAYSAPLAYNSYSAYGSPYAALPYAYKTGYYI